MKRNVISVFINDREDIYNKYNENKLSNELGGYIYNQSLPFKLDKNVKIDIKTKFEIDDVEKEKIKKLIKEYFDLGIKETLVYYKFNNIKNIILSVLGILLIIASRFSSNNYLISEVFLIVGWVAIWEVFDNILLVETKKRFKLKRLKKLKKYNITFDN